MVRVKITWLGQGDGPLEPTEIKFGRYTLPKGVPVMVGDDIIVAPALRENPQFRVEEVDL